MIEWFLINQFNVAKSLHLIALIAWMAGIFYLPRLFVYHCQVDVGSAEDKRFQTMEAKLLRVIMNPAMILTWIAGVWMLCPCVVCLWVCRLVAHQARFCGADHRLSYDVRPLASPVCTRIKSAK